MKTWVVYSLLRLGIFAAALALLLVIGVPGWIAAIVAAIIAFCISYLFLGRQRAGVAELLEKSRADEKAEKEEYDSDTLGVDPAARRRIDSDEDSEDDAVDAPRASGTGLERDGGTER